MDAVGIPGLGGAGLFKAKRRFRWGGSGGILAGLHSVSVLVFLGFFMATLKVCNWTCRKKKEKRAVKQTPGS